MVTLEGILLLICAFLLGWQLAVWARKRRKDREF